MLSEIKDNMKKLLEIVDFFKNKITLDDLILSDLNALFNKHSREKVLFVLRTLPEIYEHEKKYYLKIKELENKISIEKKSYIQKEKQYHQKIKNQKASLVALNNEIYKMTARVNKLETLLAQSKKMIEELKKEKTHIQSSNQESEEKLQSSVDNTRATRYFLNDVQNLGYNISISVDLASFIKNKE